MSTNTAPTADATNEPTVETLLQVVGDLKETVEAQSERIDELEQSLADHKQHTGRVAAGIRRRVSDIEDRVEAVEDAESPEPPAAEGDSDGSTPTLKVMKRVRPPTSRRSTELWPWPSTPPKGN